MANVSSSNGIEKRPKLRFSEFYSNWISIKLGFAGEFYGGLSGKSKEDFGHGDAKFITYRNVFSNTFASDKLLESVDVNQNESQNRVRMGDVLFTQSSETFEELGMSSVWLHSTEPFLNSFCMGWHPNSSDLNPVFLGYLLRTPTIRKQIICQGQGISRINLAASRISNIDLYHPLPDEQLKIANLLSLLDRRIEVNCKIIEHLKKYKRGVSKKLFDEIHNDSSCAIKQFSEVFELLQNNTFSRECLTNELADVLNIHYGDILVKYGSVVDLNIDIVPFIKPETDIRKYNRLSYLRDGDIIFADTAEDYTVGKMCEVVNVSDRKILSGLHTMPYRPLQTFAPMYLGYYFNSAAFREQILPMIQGAKVSSISKSEMKKTIVCIPSIETQRKVVNILYTLDKRIKGTELVLQELQQIKKGLLQNLFI